MVRTVRGVIVLLAVALLGFATAPASSAAVSPSPSASTPTGGPDDEYPPPALFSAQVTPTCVEDVAAVSYAVTGLPAEVTTVNVTFQNSSGTTVNLTDVPLTGKIKALIKAGIAINFEAGTQVVPVAAPAVTVNCGQVLESPSPSPTPTPSTQVLADPPSTPKPTATPVSQVLADPAPVSNATVLSATGSNDAPLLAAAIAFIVIGAAAVTIVTISRRRRNA